MLYQAVIIVPDIPVMFMLNQLILIHLNIQQKVSICTSSFWMVLIIESVKENIQLIQSVPIFCYL